MALKNVFDYVATESTLRRILHALSFAKTSTDQMRVVVDSGIINNTTYWGNAGTYVTWYSSTGSSNSMDPREQMKAQARANMQQIRLMRWTIT